MKRRITEGLQRKCLSFLLFPTGNNHVPTSFLKKYEIENFSFIFSTEVEKTYETKF